MSLETELQTLNQNVARDIKTKDGFWSQLLALLKKLADTVTGGSASVTIAGQPIAVNSTVVNNPSVSILGQPIKVQDQGSLLDAFGRKRVSSVQTIFDSKQLFDAKPLSWDDVTISGAASSVYSSNRASSMLTVAALTAGVRVRQTRRRFNYQPGKSQAAFITTVLGAPTTGVVREVGMFDDSNGIFLRADGTGLSWVIRSFVTGVAVETVVASAAWNNPLGETLPTIDPTKSQILAIDFEWLGVGSVRVGFVIDGKIYYVHQFNHANNMTAVYMSTPNLPVRYRLGCSGVQAGPATLECICSTVMSEGGVDATGQERSISRGATVLTVAAAATQYPLVAVRLKSTHLGATVLPSGMSMMVTTTQDVVCWRLLLNPTQAGTAYTWIPLANSAFEYALPTNTSTVTGGVVLHAGFTQSGSNESLSIASDDAPALGSTVAGVSDIFVLSVERIGASVDVTAELSVRESF